MKGGTVRENDEVCASADTVFVLSLFMSELFRILRRTFLFGFAQDCDW